MAIRLHRGASNLHCIYTLAAIRLQPYARACSKRMAMDLSFMSYAMWVKSTYDVGRRPNFNLTVHRQIEIVYCPEKNVGSSFILYCMTNVLTTAVCQ